MKASFEHELSRVGSAIGEMERAGWCDGVTVAVVPGPSAYLFGEETGVARGRRRSSTVPADRPALPPRSRPRRPDGAARRRRPSSSPAPAAPTSHRHWSTTSRRSPTSPASSPTARPGSEGWGLRSRRGPSSARSRGTPAVTGVAEVPMGTPLSDDHRGDRRRRPRAGARSSRPSRVSPMRSCRRRSSTRRRPTRRWPGSARASARPVSSSSTTRWIPSPRRTPSPDSSPSSRAVSANRASSTDWPSPTTSTPFATRRRPTTTSTACATRSRRSIAVPAALAQQQRRVVTSALALFPDCVDRHLAGDLPAATCDLMLPIVDLVEGQAILDTSSRRQAAGLDVRADLVGRITCRSSLPTSRCTSNDRRSPRRRPSPPPPRCPTSSAIRSGRCSPAIAGSVTAAQRAVSVADDPVRGRRRHRRPRRRAPTARRSRRTGALPVARSPPRRRR